MKKRLAKIADQTAPRAQPELACALIVTKASIYSPQKPVVPLVPPNSIVTMLMFAPTVARTAKRAQQEMVFVQNAIQTLNSSKISTILVRLLAWEKRTALLTKLARIAVLTAIHVMIRLELAHSVEMALNYTQTKLV